MTFIYPIFVLLFKILGRLYSFHRAILLLLKLRRRSTIFIGRAANSDEHDIIRRKPKPGWVREEVIRLKAFMPKDGCRKVADTFNRLYRENRGMTVGKSYVYETIRKHQYEIQVLRHRIKNRKPRTLPKNLLWSLDLTQTCDEGRELHTLFGIVDAGTRACLSIRKVSNKASFTLLRCLLEGIERYGKPKCVRTDNEAVFTSRLFRFGLWLLGIRHQRSEVCCPWQNGKVERFFGTFKERLKHYTIQSAESLSRELMEFRFWYNHVRTHQYLNGRTPAEAWSKSSPNSQGKHYYFDAWDGALSGYYLPPA